MRQPRSRASCKSTERLNTIRLLAVLLAVCCLSACGARRVPNLERIFEGARARQGKRPIIVVPGVLGSELVNRETGEVVWVSALRSRDDGLSLPTDADLDSNKDDLVPRDIVRRAKLAPVVPEIYVYQDLIDALQKFAGYREVRWDAATAGDERDTFYVFAYDWRRDNVRSAQELVARIEELKQRLGQPDLRFDIVAHSMGGLVARYAAMYGAADLRTDEPTTRPTWAGARHINSVFMFGTPNEGSMEAFATLLGGYSITEGLRRRVPLLNKLSRTDALTIPSTYQLLPAGSAATFLDERLEPLTLDLFDPALWRRYGWNETNGKDEAGVVSDEFLAAALRRARVFRRALDAETETNAPVRLFAFGGDCEETLARPVVVRDEARGRWLTYTEARRVPAFVRGKRKRSELVRLMYEPGDGRVTRGSLLFETKRASSPTAAPVLASAVFACELHGDVQRNKNLQDNALTAIIAEALR